MLTWNTKERNFFSAKLHCLHDNLHFDKEYVLVHLCFPDCFDQSNDHKIQSRRRLSSRSCSWRELGPCEYHSCHSVLGGTEKMGLAVQVPQQKGKQGAIPNHCKSVKSPWTEMLLFLKMHAHIITNFQTLLCWCILFQNRGRSNKVASSIFNLEHWGEKKMTLTKPCYENINIKKNSSHVCCTYMYIY